VKEVRLNVGTQPGNERLRLSKIDGLLAAQLVFKALEEAKEYPAFFFNDGTAKNESILPLQDWRKNLLPCSC